MRKLKNSIFITTQGTYLHKRNDTLIIEKDQKILVQLPIFSISNIFCFGNVLLSPFLLGFCGENDVNVSFFTNYGRYLGRFVGIQKGNILLRRRQFQYDNSLSIAKNIVAAKIQSQKRVLQRFIRNHGEEHSVSDKITYISLQISKLAFAKSLDEVRGIEGECASLYFSVFSLLIQSNTGFSFFKRSKRPPLDEVNVLLSLGYSVLGNEIAGALQSVGLDPQLGFLHEDRSGRNSLALDILEEFRAWWIDRLVLTMINRHQISKNNFVFEVSGACSLSDEGRRKFFEMYQKKKLEKIIHPYLKEEVEIGLLPILQASLLAKHIRGDLECYPAFLMR